MNTRIPHRLTMGLILTVLLMNACSAPAAQPTPVALVATTVPTATLAPTKTPLPPTATQTVKPILLPHSHLRNNLPSRRARPFNIITGNLLSDGQNFLTYNTKGDGRVLGSRSL